VVIAYPRRRRSYAPDVNGANPKQQHTLGRMYMAQRSHGSGK
jgi:hypothetical protein